MHEMVGMVLSVVFLLVTLTFYLLDRRNRQLIHYVEEKIRDFEEKYFDDISSIFIKEYKAKCDGDGFMGHTSCFKIIYITSYIVSFVFLVFSIFCACYYAHL